jgi:adenylate cyclase
MFTDIVGYTSLTGSNEELALRLLDEHRKIVRPLISVHNGKEVKTIGDAFLVEFSSAVEAMRCAYEIQDALHDLNLRRRDPKERLLIRIGIHIGDVIHSADEDVYGDAVNIGSRIERLSEPGGISISRQVYESVRNNLRDVRFESLGFQQMKNVKNDIEVFKVVMPWSSEPSSMLYESGDREEAQPRSRIAVLPFVNYSAEQSDEFFADGLTEELISRLSQAKDLRVIARTSAMNYKNVKEKKVRDIARELGAGTIVEGSVRKAGDKVRITVQVINGINEEHMWASTYDRKLDDIFEIQTDIATKVCESFSSNLGPIIRKKIRAAEEKETENVTAYTYFLRARQLLYGESESSSSQALGFFHKAIEEDPDFARAYVGRAEATLSLLYFGHSPWIESTRKAEADLRIALRLDPDLAEAHAVLSQVHFNMDEFAAAEAEAGKAVELNPSLSDAYYELGHLEWIRGHLGEATKTYEIAYKLDPLKEENFMMLSEMYRESGREQDALRLWSSAEHLFPQVVSASLTMYYLQKSNFSEANEYFEKFKLAGGDSLYAWSCEAMIATFRGDKQKALELILKIENSGGDGSVTLGMIGMIYYALGDMDKFFEYMNRAMDIHALPLGNLVNDPLYEKARRDPRFDKLIQRLDLKIDLLPSSS